MKVTTVPVLATVFCFADVTASSPLHGRYHAIKDSHNVPRKWSRVGPAPVEHWINLNIGLKQSRFEELEKQLYEGTSTWIPFSVSC